MKKLLCALIVILAPIVQAAERPNVILIITDDQGYGDIHANGNPIIHTPNMDTLHDHSVRFTNFHVDPTCAETRSALMSGRYSTRTGVWHTIMGRSLMSTNEITIAESLRAAGYRTAMFGKWHLGDTYPLRPEDQGFEDTLHIRGGGDGQGPDWWGNDYFDDTYYRNDKPEKFEGYCTDVWFREALKYIGKHKAEPFFVYLATNAPHGPYNVPDKYADPYRKQGLTDTMSRFYGMIENIDENLGVLLAKLDEWHLRDNTILIFMSDNGSAAGMQGNKKWPGYNADMRGTKGSEYEGGHRVPCFIQWPAGGIGDPRKENSGRDEDYLSAHFDLQPTIEELCDVMHPDGPPRDGISLATRIRNPVAPMPDRTLFVHSQRVAHPIEWRKCSVMTQQWRLVNGDQLYEIHKDPGETNNLAKDNPDEVAKLRQAYIDWWKTLEPVFGDYVRAGVGSDKQNPVEFMSHDWLVEDQRDSPWAQELVKRGLMTSGPWAIDVLRDGKYEVTLSRWPLHLNQSAEAVHAKLTIGGQTVEKDVTLADTSVKFTLTLPKGPAMMQSWLTTPEGKVRGAYFATVKRVE